MSTPGEMVERLEADLFRADYDGLDWKFLDQEKKDWYHMIALKLVLEGWTK